MCASKNMLDAVRGILSSPVCPDVGHQGCLAGILANLAFCSGHANHAFLAGGHQVNENTRVVGVGADISNERPNGGFDSNLIPVLHDSDILSTGFTNGLEVIICNAAKFDFSARGWELALIRCKRWKFFWGLVSLSGGSSKYPPNMTKISR